MVVDEILSTAKAFICLDTLERGLREPHSRTKLHCIDSIFASLVTLLDS